ncbi:MAG: DUF6153 family protein [Ilumatobacteraceae bacterium]
MLLSAQRGPLWQRILLSVLVVGALVGMHHLAAQDCSVATSEHSGHHAVVAAQDLIPATDSADLQESGPSLVMACLAILILVGVTPRLAAWIRLRKSRSTRNPSYASAGNCEPRPPDLHLLSVSRT